MINPLRFGLALCLLTAVLASSAGEAPTNSVVRFRISHGATLFGDIDVELFDAEKPLTVSNFLFYAQSGAYNNTVLHYLYPGFFMEGGLSTVANPYSSSPVEGITDILTNAPIPNELNVGPFKSNTFGTLAMEHLDNDPDSATCAWFFNLANNVDFDTLNGGYAVFGRVTNGLSVLQRFNASPSREVEIIDTSLGNYEFFCPTIFTTADDVSVTFENLPFAPNKSECVRYMDLFTVQVLMVRGPDLVRPKATVAYPPSNLVITNDTIVVRGTSSDAVGVAYVEVFVGTVSSAVIAAGTNSWSAALTNLPPGTNVITVVATDTSGMKSIPVTRTIFRSLPWPLGLEIDGAGFVTGATNGQLLELGRNYTLAAKPAPLNLFSGWSGSVEARDATLRFMMKTNTAISAVFATNLFPSVKGTYTGLFFDTNLATQASSGGLSLTVGSAGAYSGKLLMEGRTFRFSGAFDPYGQVFPVVPRSGSDELFLYLQLSLEPGGNVLTGLITTNSTFDPATNGTWLAELTADRAVFSRSLNPTPLAGRYTMLLPPGSNSSTLTIGDGYGAVTVSSAGKISFSGALADGTKLTHSAPLSQDGVWPLYASLYAGRGMLLGWVNFNTNSLSTDFDGDVVWLKQNLPVARYYASGLSNTLSSLGSRLVPSSTNPVIALTHPTLGFTNGNLPAPFSIDVVMTAKSAVLGTNGRSALTLSKATGLFTGSIKPPGGGSSLAFKGALLQKQNLGSGFFLGTNESGRVFLGD